MDRNLSVKQFIMCLNEHTIELNDLRHLLESKHENLVEIFQTILHHPKYRSVAQGILQNMISNMYKMLSEKLQIHIISNIWKKQFLSLFPSNYHTSTQIKIKSQEQTTIYLGVFMFLCQKMRSLKFKVRISALKSFDHLLRSIIQLYSPQGIEQQMLSKGQADAFQKIFAKSLKLMLKKEQLAKVVSYNQGLFLQLLEDEYHEIRVTTLAVLELISLQTPYFYSSSHAKEKGHNDQSNGQTINSLKQTILYMLNDEHELVRQRSLVAIFRISEEKSKFQNFKVFSSLTREEIFTILMCLRENNAVLRQKVYECLKVLSLISIDQLFLILQKLYQTLLIYKQDKTKIYLLLKSFSKSQKQLIIDFIDTNPKENIKLFYQFNNEDQPSCKNFIYKGRLILLREVIQNMINNKLKPTKSQSPSNQKKYSCLLPWYIIRHLSYVEDTEFKLKLSQTQVQQKNQQNSYRDIQINQEILLQQSGSNSIKLLKQIKSILEYEITICEIESFQHEFINIILDSLSLMIPYYEKTLHQQNPLSRKNRIQQQNFKQDSWFDVLAGPNRQSKSIIDNEFTIQPKVSQVQILNLLYSDSPQSYSKKESSVWNEKKIQQKVSQIYFAIKSLKYIYGLNDSYAHLMEYHNKITLINQILYDFQVSIRNLSISNDIQVDLKYLSNNIRLYLKSLSKKCNFKSKCFRIRPITIGRSNLGTGYNDKLLIMIEHPYKIIQKNQLQYHNQNIWLKCTALHNHFNQQKNQFMFSLNSSTFYIKFEDLFIISQTRPLIDYNEKKTIYTAELPIKIVNSKYNNLITLINQSIRSKDQSKLNSQMQIRNKPIGKTTDQINLDKYMKYQEREIIIQKVSIIFVSNPNNLSDPSHKLQKVLADWNSSSQ